MDKVTYLAVFEPTENGKYSVYFPDLPGCIGCGVNYQTAYDDAVKALKMHIRGMMMADENIPAASDDVAPDPDTAEGYIIKPVTAYVKSSLSEETKQELGKAIKAFDFEFVSEDKVKW